MLRHGSAGGEGVAAQVSRGRERKNDQREAPLDLLLSDCTRPLQQPPHAGRGASGGARGEGGQDPPPRVRSV